MDISKQFSKTYKLLLPHLLMTLVLILFLVFKNSCDHVLENYSYYVYGGAAAILFLTGVLDYKKRKQNNWDLNLKYRAMVLIMVIVFCSILEKLGIIAKHLSSPLGIGLLSILWSHSVGFFRPLWSMAILGWMVVIYIIFQLS